jgi:hypothetical protein
MRGVRRFEQRLTAAIARVNGFAAPEQTVLGDGAGSGALWAMAVAADNLPEAVPVLDRWHLREERRRALRAALPDKEERTPARANAACAGATTGWRPPSPSGSTSSMATFQPTPPPGVRPKTPDYLTLPLWIRTAPP